MTDTLPGCDPPRCPICGRRLVVTRTGETLCPRCDAADWLAR